MAEEINPYSVPVDAVSGFEKTIFESDFKPIIGSVMWTPEYYITSFDRFRSLSLLRRLWLWARWWIAGFFVVTSISTAWAIAMGAPVAWWGVIFLPALSVLTMSSVRIDNWNLRRRCKNVPATYLEISITPSHFSVRSDSVANLLSWSQFAGAVIFPDGVLLLPANQAFVWIPDSAFQNWDDKDRLHQLICAKLTSDKVGWRCPAARSKLQGVRLQKDWMNNHVES